MDAFLASLLLITLSEIGDKTQLLAFILAARLRKPSPIIAGMFVATLANHSLAGSVGAWIAKLIPLPWLPWITGSLFIAFGLWTLRPDSLDDDPRLHRGSIFITTLIAFFIAEMGDKTQLATAALGAQFNGQLFGVVAGTTLGMMLVDVPAVIAGERLTKKLPLKAIRWTAAAVFILTGVMAMLGVPGTAF